MAHLKYHDMLARLGVANAHPGGGNLSAVWMNRVSVPDGAEVLDLGCGNGATACAMAKRWPCQVTALDIRSKMLENTRRRARREGVAVRTVRGSAEALPFPDHQFDLVVCESVLVFVRLPRALAEIARVLKPNGRVVDVEMMTLRPVTPEWREGVRRIYGVEHVPDLSGWRSSFQAAGFACKVLRSGPIQRLEMSDNQRDDEVADQHALSDPQVLQLIEANGRWLEANHQTMGYGVFLLNVANSPT